MITDKKNKNQGSKDISFGRDEELKVLSDSIFKKTSGIGLIYGEIGWGKTTLVTELSKRLQADKNVVVYNSLYNSKYIPFYDLLSQLNSILPDKRGIIKKGVDFIKNLIKSTTTLLFIQKIPGSRVITDKTIWAKIKQMKEREISKEIKDLKDYDTLRKQDNKIKQLFDQLNREFTDYYPEKRLVIIFDDFGKTTQQYLDFLNYVFFPPPTNTWIFFIFETKKKKNELLKEIKSSSGVAEVLELQLKPLEKVAAERIILTKNPDLIDEAHQIYELSGGVPLLINELLHFKSKEIESLILPEEFIKKISYLYDLRWESLSNEEKSDLMLISLIRTPLSFKLIQEVLKDEKGIRINNLIEKDFIKSIQKHDIIVYSIQNEIWRSYLDTKPLFSNMHPKQKTHLKIAKFFEGLIGFDQERIEIGQYSELAYHYHCSGDQQREKAFRYNYIGGILSHRQYFYYEAIEMLNNSNDHIKVIIESKRELYRWNINNELGVLYKKVGNFKRSLELHLVNLDKIDELNDLKLKSATYDNLSASYIGLNDYDNAIFYANKAYELHKKLNDEKMIISLGNIGNIYYNLENYGPAEEKFKLLIEKTKDKKQFEDTLRKTYNNLGGIYVKKGRLPEARLLFEDSLKIAESQGNPSGISTALHKLGEVYQKEMNYSEAYKNFEKGLDLARSNGLKVQEADHLKNLALVEKERGNYKEAEVYFWKEMKIREKINSPKGIANIFINLSNLKIAKKRFNDALNYINKAKEIFNRLKIFNLINELSLDEVNIYLTLNELEKAKVTLESIEFSSEQNSTDFKARYYLTCGEINKREEDYKKASMFYNKAFNEFKKNNSKIGISFVYQNIANLEYTQKKYNDSIKNTFKSLKIKEVSGHAKGLISSYSLLSKNYGQLGKFLKSEKYAAKCFQICNKIGDYPQIFRLSQDLSLICSGKNEILKETEYKAISLLILPEKQVKLRETITREIKFLLKKIKKESIEFIFLEDKYKTGHDKGKISIKKLS